jgi:hypothetical protein
MFNPFDNHPEMKATAILSAWELTPRLRVADTDPSSAGNPLMVDAGVSAAQIKFDALANTLYMVSLEDNAVR